ncbi:uncharacterized protein BDZ99DRAFT_513379 [Mytilinidion resinicola]|uniref:Uncharacterized protein n=1 Tax=Mytilinidion resinicola TaxID=574789 RepID=A0A6A6Z7N5_9PEZI|nr:uncharacterized protein BDZ99DRAFT_513379 [Mytilinidion resinicola]KAF2817122.1 hypothetical protein BDZ99DRAFT_513379 [Mytilinidion resinicola]
MSPSRTASLRSPSPVSTTSISTTIKTSQAITRLAILRTTTPTIHSITTALYDFDTALSTFSAQRTLLSTLRSEYQAQPEGAIDPDSLTLTTLLATIRLQPQELPEPEVRLIRTLARGHAITLVAALCRVEYYIQYIIDCLGTHSALRTNDTRDGLFTDGGNDLSVLGKDVNRVRLRNILRILSSSTDELLARIVKAVEEDEEVDVKAEWVAEFKTESEQAGRVVQRLKEAVAVFETIEVEWEGGEDLDVESPSSSVIGVSDAGSDYGSRAGRSPDARTASWHGSGEQSPARSAASGKCYLCGRSPMMSPVGSVHSSYIPSSPSRSLTGSTCACGEDHVGVI